MDSFEELNKAFKKDYGDNIGGLGHHYADIVRIPTGFFPFDLSSGGGVPMGKITEIYGKESSCKTNMAMKIVANAQKLWPEKKNVWFDVEGTYDKKWARKFGIDTEALYTYRPDFGEQLVDMLEGILGNSQCGVVVIDSIAAVMTTRELGQSAEKQDVGGSGMVMSKMIRKSTAALQRAEKEGYFPTLICINQTRTKIGVMFGNPESTPGGDVKNFAYSMRVRLYGKDKVDAKVHDSLPISKEVTYNIIKHKVPIVSKTGDMELVMVPHNNLTVGECNDFNILKVYMIKHEILVQGKTEWVLLGEHTFKTLRGVKDLLDEDIRLATDVKLAIIEAEKEMATREEINKESEEDEDIEVDEDGVVTEKPAKKKPGRKPGKKK